MPRQIVEIPKFNYGVISAVDAQDIPIEAASDNLNIDGDAGEGRLQGIPTDTEYQTSGSTALTNVKLGEFIENNGTYDFIYHNANTDKIIKITDFYGTKTVLDLVTSNVSDNASIIQNNKEVHIGTGSGSSNIPKWAGYSEHSVFPDEDDFFIGVGLDDMVGRPIGAYTGTETAVFEVEIDGTGTPDTFKWRKNGGSYTTLISITAGVHTLSDGITIAFGATTGHTLGDKWFVSIYKTGTFVVEDAECKKSGSIVLYGDINQIIPDITTHSGTESNFLDGYTYRWMGSFIYDGYQESPAFYEVTGFFQQSALGSATTDYCTVRVYLPKTITEAYNFNKRITGINIYRSESTSSLGSFGLMRLIRSIQLDEFTNVDVDTGGFYTEFTDYGGSTGTTYEENTGIPETLDDTILNYALAARGNNYLFIGQCSHSEIPDAGRYIFRSKELRYDMFDWSKDFLVMPKPITALAFYDGKLWAWSLNKIYRINPEGLYIEDDYENAGALNSRAVHTNDFGMFWGNQINAYMYQGGTITPIGDMIKNSKSSGKSWGTFLFTTLTDLIVTSDAKKGYVLFVNERTDSTAKYFAWGYNPFKKRWDAFSFAGYATSANGGTFKGKDGEVYISNGTGTYKLMRNTGYQAWEWYSQEMDFGESGQDKSMVMMKADTSGTVSINYGTNRSTPSTAYTSGTLINQYKKSIRAKLSAASGSNFCNALEFIARPLIGKR